MGYEVERKWVLEKMPDFNSPDLWVEGSSLIHQGYILTDPEVRLRQNELHFYLTVKTAGALVRQELETKITPDEYGRLWPMTEGRRIEKQRASVVVNTSIGHCYYELDRYLGRHDGLIVVEKEFGSIEAAEDFRISSLLGPATEVTADARYKNRWLAEHGLP